MSNPKSFVSQLAAAMRKDATATGSLPIVDTATLTLVSIAVYSAPLADVRAISIAARAEGKATVTERIRLPRQTETVRALVCITTDGRRVHLMGVS